MPIKCQSKFNRVSKIINESTGKQVTFDYVVNRYDVTKEQLKVDMKNLRWENKRGVIYFDLIQIRSRYQVDSYKLETLAKLEACKVKPDKNRRI